MIKEKNRKLRDKRRDKGRMEINKKIKEGTYMSEMREKYGIMNEAKFISDKDFLKDMIFSIEEDRLRRMVYDKSYQRLDLDEWIEQRDKKVRNRDLKERMELKKFVQKKKVNN